MRAIQYVMNQEGDWCAIYVNGEIWYEGHTIPEDVWVQLLGAEEYYDAEGKFGSYLELWGGHFPQFYSEIEATLNGFT